MYPFKFKNYNIEFAKNQPEYLPLPAHISEDGTVTTCWELNDHDIENLMETKKLWLQILTFNNPLQPVMISVEKPEL